MFRTAVFTAVGVTTALMTPIAPAQAAVTYKVHYHIEAPGYKHFDLMYLNPHGSVRDDTVTIKVKNQSGPFDLDAVYTSEGIMAPFISGDATISPGNIIVGVPANASMSCSVTIDGEVVVQKTGGSMIGCDYTKVIPE